MTAAWDAVAAVGTDPERLAALVGALQRRSAVELQRAVAAAVDEGATPTDALVEVVDRLDRPLDVPDPVADAWRERGVRVALLGDAAYPLRLTLRGVDASTPLLLATRGDPSAITGSPAVAIVGARRASAYGTGIAAWLAEACAAAGVAVVSGGAVGIDAAAHAATVDAGGRTAVVLGCGHACDYPRAHARPDGLFDRVVRAGGAVVTEHLPATPPKPGVVRARNRIVAALVDAVVVVEGRRRSGSLVTARCAADLGVPVLAVPGDIRAPGSGAPHLLLGEGAAPCTGPADLLEAVGREPAAPSGSTGSSLPEPVRRALASRWPRAVPVDVLAEEAGVAAARLLGILTRARVAGEIAESVEGVRLTRAPH